MSLLEFISDEKLREYTKEVLDKVLLAYSNSETTIHSNVIDPFSALFDSMRQGITAEDWLSQEKSRQVQKTLQNAVGDFHQNVLGSVDGWMNPGRGGGYDLISSDKKIIAEIKNKFNTLNAASGSGTYTKLVRYLDSSEFSGYTAYVVFVVPKTPRDFISPWSPSAELYPLRDDLKKIDGESFYRLVTGIDDALEQLFDVLPGVVSDILEISNLDERQKFFFKELFVKAYK